MKFTMYFDIIFSLYLQPVFKLSVIIPVRRWSIPVAFSMYEINNVSNIVVSLSLQPLIKFKSHLYYEEKDYVSEAERNLTPAEGSKVRDRLQYSLPYQIL